MTTPSKASDRRLESKRRVPSRRREVKADAEMTSAHPLKSDYALLRRLILAVRSDISEGIKWNAPSFRTEKEWFATFNVRAREEAAVVLHFGAKVRPQQRSIAIEDPAGLLTWRSHDRAIMTAGKGPSLTRNRAAITNLIKAWLAHL